MQHNMAVVLILGSLIVVCISQLTGKILTYTAVFVVYTISQMCQFQARL